MIELGYAVKSIGWERTILILNSHYGDAKNLPFDILQHRWPITYKLTDKSENLAEKEFNLSLQLENAFNSCEQYSINRVQKMFQKLDTDTVNFIVENSEKHFIDMRAPSENMGQVLIGLRDINLTRRLVDLGAIRVVDDPTIGYAWTSDGLELIKEARRVFSGLIQKQSGSNGDNN